MAQQMSAQIQKTRTPSAATDEVTIDHVLPQTGSTELTEPMPLGDDDCVNWGEEVLVLP
jgi:hypothetical protein